MMSFPTLLLCMCWCHSDDLMCCCCCCCWVHSQRVLRGVLSRRFELMWHTWWKPNFSFANFLVTGGLSCAVGSSHAGAKLMLQFAWTIPANRNINIHVRWSRIKRCLRCFMCRSRNMKTPDNKTTFCNLCIPVSTSNRWGFSSCYCSVSNGLTLKLLH